MKKFLNTLGIDGSIFFTILSRIIQAGGGVIIMILVSQCLTQVEQGYYFTFGSVLAIQVFFELGLSNIIIQLVAHENAHIFWTNQTSCIGNEESISRLASLLRFTARWFGVIALLLSVALLMTGYFFFNKYGKNNVEVNWQIPWIILSITTALSLIISSLLAFFEGLGKVKDVAQIRLAQQITQLLLVVFLFFSDFKLFSIPIASLIAFFIVPIWILSSPKIELLKFIWSKIGKWQVNYRLEIFPLQWKIALSWISGYFIFQLFNPVLFATEGAVIAGQMGLTLAVLNSIFSLSFSWITTKISVFSGLIARKDFKELDRIFDKTLIQSVVLNVFGLFFFFILILLLRYVARKTGVNNFADRFLAFLPLLFMMIPILLNHIVGSWATYLRCHKQEPMLLASIVMGFLCSVSTIFFGKYHGVFGMTLAYMILSIIGFVWSYIIFKSKKRLWHNE